MRVADAQEHRLLKAINNVHDQHKLRYRDCIRCSRPVSFGKGMEMISFIEHETIFYILTAAHVLFDALGQNVSIIRTLKSSDGNFLWNENVELHVHSFQLCPSIDVAVLRPDENLTNAAKFLKHRGSLALNNCTWDLATDLADDIYEPGTVVTLVRSTSPPFVSEGIVVSSGKQLLISAGAPGGFSGGLGSNTFFCGLISGEFPIEGDNLYIAMLHSRKEVTKCIESQTRPSLSPVCAIQHVIQMRNIEHVPREVFNSLARCCEGVEPRSRRSRVCHPYH